MSGERKVNKAFRVTTFLTHAKELESNLVLVVVLFLESLGLYYKDWWVTTLTLFSCYQRMKSLKWKQPK